MENTENQSAHQAAEPLVDNANEVIDGSDETIVFFDGEEPGNGSRHSPGPASAVTPGLMSSVEFDFRQYALNPLVEVASGLLALFIRLQDLEVLADPYGVRTRVAEEIRRLESELENLRYVTEVGDNGEVVRRRVERQSTTGSQFQSGEPLYDFPIINAFKYCLCTMIDEGVMANRRESIGNNPAWREESLLSEFHNETWGGEKVFLIKDRLIREPERYQDFLEFLYLMFTLGYRGKYSVAYSGSDRFERVVAELYDTLRELRGDVDEVISEPLANLKVHPEHVRPSIPPIAIVLLFCVVIAALFAVFWFRVEGDTQNILIQLESLLADSADNSSIATRPTTEGSNP